MVLYLEKFFETAEEQTTESLFAAGHLSLYPGSHIYVNVSPKELATFKKNPTAKFEEFPWARRLAEAYDAFEANPIEYKDNCHIVLEIMVNENDKKSNRGLRWTLIEAKGYRRVFNSSSGGSLS